MWFGDWRGENLHRPQGSPCVPCRLHCGNDLHRHSMWAFSLGGSSLTGLSWLLKCLTLQMKLLWWMKSRCWETRVVAGPGPEWCSVCRHFHPCVPHGYKLYRKYTSISGLCAEEIHLCGEASAIDFVQEIAELIGDTFEVKHYNRLTPLEIMDKPLGISDWFISIIANLCCLMLHDSHSHVLWRQFE